MPALHRFRVFGAGRPPGRRLAFALAAGLLIAGCGGAAAAAKVVPEISPWTPPDGQRCSAAGGGFAIGAILDSVAAVRAVEAVGPADGALLLSVSVDSTGTLSRFHVIETTLPEPEAEPIAAEIEGVVRGETARRRLGRILLEVADGRVTVLRSGASRTCLPAIANEPAVQRALAAQHRTLGEVGSAVVWLFVDTAGNIERSHVQISSGDPELDRAILEAGRTARFHPALIDRAPVAVWAQIRLTLEPYCPPSMASERIELPLDDPCRDAPFRP